MTPATSPSKVSAKIGHICIEVSDLDRSGSFYDRFLGRLGFHRFVRETDYAGYANGELSVWVIREPRGRIRRHPISGEEEVVAEHFAFLLPSPAEVESVQSDLERAELYPVFRYAEHPEFRPGYVSVSWADPDNVILEVYHVPAPKRTRPRAGRANRVTRRRAGKPKRRRGRAA